MNTAMRKMKRQFMGWEKIQNIHSTWAHIKNI